MNYTEMLNQLKEWACNLLIMQYRYAPKNREFIKVLSDIVFVNVLILKIRDLCLNVEESEGAQLDVVGKWVGIDRYYNGIDLWKQPYTALVNYSNVSDNTYEDWQGGFSSFDMNSPYFIGNNNGGFLTYEQYRNTRISVNEIGDEYFRQLIKLKIIKNSIAFTNKNIDDAIWEWSGGQIYTTWGTMEVTYHYPLSMINIMQLAIYKDVLLAPTGCTINTEVY